MLGASLSGTSGSKVSDGRNDRQRIFQLYNSVSYGKGPKAYCVGSVRHKTNRNNNRNPYCNHHLL